MASGTRLGTLRNLRSSTPLSLTHASNSLLILIMSITFSYLVMVDIARSFHDIVKYNV